MKKTITSIAALFLFASISNAAETTKKSPSSADNKSVVAAVSALSLTQLLEENVMLRTQLVKLNEDAEIMQTKLDYSGMMNATLSNLQNVRMNQAAEDTKNQLDYAKMMTTTMVNLSVALAKYV